LLLKLIYVTRRRPIDWWIRVFAAAATWAVTVVTVEAAAENEIGRTARQLEERIELQLRLMEQGPEPQPESTPARPHEDTIEPWELVGV
jgi:hypothetical protein